MVSLMAVSNPDWTKIRKIRGFCENTWRGQAKALPLNTSYRLGVFPIDLLGMSQAMIVQGFGSLTNASPMQTRTHGDSRCLWKQGTRMKSGPPYEAISVPNKDCCGVPATYKL